MSIDNLPLLWCPFKPAINQYASSADRRSLEWARRFDLLHPEHYPPDITSIQYGRFAAHVYPNAAAETLQIAADWCSWLFLLDDNCDETGIGCQPEQMLALHERLLAVLRGATVTESDIPLAHALHDLRLRMQRHASEGWLWRFTQTVEAYFAANRWEANNRRLGETPSVNIYYAMRPLTGAVYPCFVLFDITDKINLPSEARNHEKIRLIELLSNYIICWGNDVLSVNKERQRGDVHNLVIALQHERRLDNTGAVREAVRIHNDTIKTFIDLAEQLPRFSPEVDFEVTRYVDCLRNSMRANLDWSRTALRYQKTFASLPSDQVFPIPQIS